jgi:hypothetical protein
MFSGSSGGVVCGGFWSSVRSVAIGTKALILKRCYDDDAAAAGIVCLHRCVSRRFENQ